MKTSKMILSAACLALAFSCGSPEVSVSPREQLLERLSGFASKGLIAYGHQDDPCYGHDWCVDDWENDSLERSDVKAVTGKYPLMVGFDLGGIELSDSCNLDGVPFGLIRKATLEHIGRGGIVTFSWHPRNPFTGGDAWDVSSDEVVRSVLPGGQKNELFSLWLTRLGDFLESVGREVPVIFRPWHENIGSWFWWGGRLCTENEYRQLYQSTWNYLVRERGLENIVWCYSPNGDCSTEEYMAKYPGDEYVDLLGVDSYELAGSDNPDKARADFQKEISDILGAVEQLGKEHGKTICLSETGLEGISEPAWWTETLYPAVKDYPIAYLLTWRNAHDNPGHFFAAWKGFENAADMKAFSEFDNIIFID